MGHARNFREFPVWQEAVDFCTIVYKVCESVPWFEKKGLSDQIQRAVVSIPSNIAEGASRPSDTDFSHSLDIALGSSYEVETQLLICKNINYITEDQYNELRSKNVAIQKQLVGLIRSIRA